MQADLETVRLAELYATHPLLRTMPVPHMRLPDVELEIPVLVKTIEEPRAGESARGGAPLADMRRKFDDALATHLSTAGVELSRAHRKKLREAVDERFTFHGVPTEIAVDVYRMADDLTSTALRVVGELRPTPDTAEAAVHSPLEAAFKETVRLEFLKLRTPPPRLTVLVTSAEIHEAGTPENMTRLRLKVSEHGVEWTTIESEGVRQSRLVPE
jgi:hypothetical protein